MSEQAKQLLSGNEAAALGAWRAGVAVGVGYPGTPSTEVLENLAKHKEPYCEWAPNEKVALEVGIGASMGGVRSLVTMKHVGVNVAADPLMSACNAGVNAGLVILAADDPSIYSSQNEQDSRNYAAFARVPMLEPADSEEVYEFMQRAFDISETFDVPVMLRETVRIAHTKTLVDVSENRNEQEPKKYEPDPKKWVMVPANARQRRTDADRRTEHLIEYAEHSDLNRVEMRDSATGIICSAAVYQQVREALPDASVLKLGISWPLPPQKIRNFAAQVTNLYVVEEACSYFAPLVRSFGVQVSDFPFQELPQAGEMTPERIKRSFGIQVARRYPKAYDLPSRPPMLCPGCPHRLVFATLRDMKAIVTGDIGCYTLGATPPLSALHSTIDMGASLSMAHGLELADVPARNERPVVGVIGDSTFAHSGITSLLGTIYNSGAGTLCILDNRTTAMTGCQGNPVNGLTLTKSAQEKLSPLDVDSKHQLNLPNLCKVLGVLDVEEIDAQDLAAVKAGLKSAIEAKDVLSVRIFKSPCRLIDKTRKPAVKVQDCQACGMCLKLGCAAIGKDDEGHAIIDERQCIGCNQCVQVCPFNCIGEHGSKVEGE